MHGRPFQICVRTSKEIRFLAHAILSSILTMDFLQPSVMLVWCLGTEHLLSFSAFDDLYRKIINYKCVETKFDVQSYQGNHFGLF